MAISVQARLVGLLLGSMAACVEPPARMGSVDPEAATEAEAGPRLAWPGTAVAEAYAVGEVRAFEIEQDARRVGRSWGRYGGPLPDHAGWHRFETRIELELPGRAPIRSEGELVLDAEGHVVRGVERSDVAELRFERRGDVLAFTDGSTHDEIVYAPHETPTAAMAHAAILHEELMLGLHALPEGEASLRLVSLSGGPPVDWRGQVHTQGEAVVIETSLGERITLEHGRIRELEVPTTGMRIRAVDLPWPAWIIAGPQTLRYRPPDDARFTIRPVELPGRPDEPELRGEVLVPRDGEGPFPAALYVSSSGREDRHGFAGPPAVDLGSHEITDALANAGFVVLRFDERGKGESGAAELLWDGQIEDARRAFRTLLVQEEVDPDRVILIGHGEGGLRALYVAAGRSLAGIALLAVPGRPYREVFLHQSEALLSQVPPELRAAAARHQATMIDAIERGDPPPLELAAEAPWIRALLQQDPEQLAQSVDAPIFIAQGGKDFEVDPSRDASAWLTMLRRRGITPTVRRYRDLDHRFKHESDVSTPDRYLAPARPVDATFLADLVAWARARTPPPPKR